jgi:hypothetical protein
VWRRAATQSQSQHQHQNHPHKKNDNAHVEQKNWTHPRHLLGYDRIGNAALIDLINDLYANVWSLYQNCFCPSMKLIAKTEINSKYKKTYDKPTTPYQRLIASGKTTPGIQSLLVDTHQNLNPFKLKKAIEKKLNIIFKSITVTPNVRLRI